MIFILAVMVFFAAHAYGLSWWGALATTGLVVAFRVILGGAIHGRR